LRTHFGNNYLDEVTAVETGNDVRNRASAVRR